MGEPDPSPVEALDDPFRRPDGVGRDGCTQAGPRVPPGVELADDPRVEATAGESVGPVARVRRHGQPPADDHGLAAQGRPVERADLAVIPEARERVFRRRELVDDDGPRVVGERPVTRRGRPRPSTRVARPSPGP